MKQKRATENIGGFYKWRLLLFSILLTGLLLSACEASVNSFLPSSLQTTPMPTATAAALPPDMVYTPTAAITKTPSTKTASLKLAHLSSSPTLFNSQDCIAIALSPDGKIMAAAKSDKTVELWNTDTNSKLAVLKGHTKEAMSLAFSPDGKMLASGGEDGTVRVWDLLTQPLANFDADNQAWFSPAMISMVAFSPDGKRLASASSDGTIKIWDTTSLTEIRAIRGAKVEEGSDSYYPSFYEVAFSPDSQTLAALGGVNPYVGGSNLRLWAVATGQEFKLANTATCHTSLLFTPDGRGIACLADTGYEIREVNSGKLLTSFDPYMQIGAVAAFSSDGQFLATLSRDGTLQLGEVSTGAEIYQTNLLQTPGMATIWFGADSRTITINRYDGSLQRWQITSK